MIKVGQLQMRLPAGFGSRGEAIARQVAQRMAHLRLSESRALDALRLDPIHVAATASNSQVTDAIVRQLAAKLGAVP